MRVSFCHTFNNTEASFIVCDPDDEDHFGNRDGSECDEKKLIEHCDAMGGYTLTRPAVTCFDIFEAFGVPSLYLKIDIEGGDRHCIRGLRDLARVRSDASSDLQFEYPRFISTELFGRDELVMTVELLTSMGYKFFKYQQQRWYCPTQHYLGCGSGPFGDLAVDVVSGHYWRDSADMLDDAWLGSFDFDQGWFDLHAALV